MPFPIHRLRRLRKTNAIIRMVRENRVSVDDLIYPLFVCEGQGIKTEISSMPDNYRWSIDLLVDEVKECDFKEILVDNGYTKGVAVFILIIQCIAFLINLMGYVGLHKWY